MNGAAERPVVGLFGAFDTGDLGEVALRRVIEGELSRRRRDVDLVALAPFGAERPIPGDEGRPARPLPPVAVARGLGLDALVMTGDVLAGDEQWARRYGIAPEAVAERGVAALALTGMRAGPRPAARVTWFAVGISDDPDVDLGALEGAEVWARNRATSEKVGAPVAECGDPVLLAARVFGVEALRRRTDLLRMSGALPAGARVVVEATRGAGPSAADRELVDALRGALRSDSELSVIVLSLDPLAQPPERRLQVDGLIAERVHHFPAWAGLDDIAAAMSGSSAVLATTPAGAHLAAALGTPTAVVRSDVAARCHPGIPVFTTDLPARIAALLAGGLPLDLVDATDTLDVAFHDLAERLPRVPDLTAALPHPDPVRSGLEILQQRLVDERTALQAELSRIQAELEHLQGSPEHRIARPIREGYQLWQRRRT